jgi:hypothetical protein
MERRLLPREAVKSRKGSVRVAENEYQLSARLGRRGIGGTGNRVVSGVIWTNIATAIAVETCHGFFAEEPKRFLEDWGGIINDCSGILEEVNKPLRE